jgi:hypothetical protein
LAFWAILILPNPSSAQIGGDNTYEFLNLVPSARIAAMGGKMLPVRDGDLNLIFGNPALLNAEMDKQFSLSHVFYYSDIKFGHVGYAHHIGKGQTVAAGLHYIHYGKFTERDFTGQEAGVFKASEYSFNLSYARDLLDSSLSIGAHLKTIYSSLAEYQSMGMAADIGLNWFASKPLLDVSLVLRNAGSQFKGYRDGDLEPLPFEIQLGVSKKLAKAPFRFSLILHHLEKFDITYKDPAKEGQVDPLTGEPIEYNITTADKILRHVVIGSEVLISRNLHFRLGYNFQRRKELGVESRMSTVGLSWGFGFGISRFSLSYGRAAYHLAGPSNHLTLAVNLGHQFRRRNNQ